MDYTTKLSNNTNPPFDMAKEFDTKIISKEFDDITNSYYKQGYEDAVNKACEWLRENRDNIETEDNGIAGWITDEFIEQFRKAMEQ